MNKALIIISHGSRSQDAVNAFNQIVELVRAKGGFDQVAGAAMEHNEPTIPQAIAQVTETGVQEIIFAPYFLYEGIHIKEDIPHMLNEIAPDYPDVTFKLAKPLGPESVLADILFERALAVK
ncbi:sirohydrochlorin chelatase [Dehalobacterium formicoaceticum]|uniref:CbiX/SirB N-terminal domain-containing protein n=1 Tax=Dehalobacterium formicoaceticum TaxID=51515 RepID=A0ABT1Y1Q6_9FIRM|nr:CbiX/SirB N-terminal domain-containing protein [Dehalobacterium formicoaceticum]MCR6544798.1 CbiX/SirB N-terminal domain-containing protein [Dehalobacterium formicoaceticum]